MTRIAIVLVRLACTAAAADSAVQLTDGNRRPSADPVLEKVGELEIPDVGQLVRVDRNKRPSRVAMRNSAFILKTRPHPVAGDRYVVLTAPRDPRFLSSLQRLAKARDGITVRVDDLAVPGRDPEKLDSLRKKLQEARDRILAVAPRKESFRENMVLGLWELTSTLDDDPQIDVLPGILLASTAKHFAALVDRSLRRRPLPASQLKPLAISQVPRAEELRSLQKAAVLRKWYARTGIATPIVAVYSRRAVEAAKLTGKDIWDLQAAGQQPVLKAFPPAAV